MPWRRKQQPALLFYPGKSHGQRRSAGFPGHRVTEESDTTDELSNNYVLRGRRRRARRGPVLLKLTVMWGSQILNKSMQVT